MATPSCYSRNANAAFSCERTICRTCAGNRNAKKLRARSAALGLLAIFLSTGVSAQVLGTAEDFAVLGGSTVTNTGSSVIIGSVGVSPGSAITGFPPGIVVAPGTIHANDAVAAQAQSDLTTAYNSLMGRPSQVDLTGQNLGGTQPQSASPLVGEWRRARVILRRVARATTRLGRGQFHLR